MKQFLVAGLTSALAAGALIASAPRASAACQFGGIVISKCDGPVQPDGTWQRCVVFPPTGGRDGSPVYVTNTNCQTLGPDQHPSGVAFNDPPTHIDDWPTKLLTGRKVRSHPVLKLRPSTLFGIGSGVVGIHLPPCNEGES